MRELTEGDYGRNQLGGGTRLQLSTPGRLLKGGLGYRIDWDSFEDDIFNGNDSLRHTIAADTSWEFLPKTALFWNGGLQFHKYDAEKSQDATAERNNLEGKNKLALVSAKTAMAGLTPGTPDYLRAQDIAMVSEEAVKKDKKNR